MQRQRSHTWRRLAIVLGVASLAAGIGCAGSSSVTSPTVTSGTSPTVVGTGSTTVTYTKDMQPILAADCVSCHGPSVQQNSVNLSTYAGVLKVVSVGNTNSLLIQVTQPGGLMYSMLSGNRTQKAQTIYDWIMTSHVAQQ